MPRPKLDDPDLPLAYLMALWPRTIPVFMRHRMLCVGCLIGPFHTLSDACTEYGLDQSDLLAELNNAIADASD